MISLSTQTSQLFYLRNLHSKTSALGFSQVGPLGLAKGADR